MPSIMFIYWGRRGISRLVHDIVEAADRRADLDWSLSVASQNDQIHTFRQFGPHLHEVESFASTTGALTGLWRLPELAGRMSVEVARRRVGHVVNLMPHVWSWAAGAGARRGGAQYHTVVHDAIAHPGDWTGFAQRVLLLDAARADRVFTLSTAVADQLAASGRVPVDRLFPLFHPARQVAQPSGCVAPAAGEPWRLLFFGRLLRYKGLPLLVEAMERLRIRGIEARLTVMGEGSLGELAPRLAALGADIVNRWVDEATFDAALASHHAMVLPYLESSQSGPAAAALGSAMPAVVTPVGGLVEQVEHRVTGLVAESVDAAGFAMALERLITEPGLHDQLVQNLVARRQARSTDAFVAAMLEHVDASASPRHR